MSREKERANVTVPEDAEDMVNWLLKYDDRFNSKLASVLAYLVSEGAKAVYAKGLEQITPLEPELLSALQENSVASVRKAAND